MIIALNWSGTCSTDHCELTNKGVFFLFFISTTKPC